MRQDTRELKSKYLYVFHVLNNERFDLFNFLVHDETGYFQVLDVDKLTSWLFNVNYLCETMVRKWHNYISHRRLMIIRFEQKRRQLKRNALKIILRPFFCSDITNEIVDFI